jgi:hypothetical protein
VRCRAIPLILFASVAGCEALTPDSGVPSTDPDYAREETERLIAFLRGEGELDPLLLADSVLLQVAPEGGGHRRMVPREALLNRAEWYAGPSSFLPPPELEYLTAEPGTHFNCVPVDLASRDTALSRMPHVGARLTSAPEADCLRSWNASFVFDADSATPRLLAVLYDQWEW